MSYRHKSEEYIKITLISASYILHKRIIMESQQRLIFRDEQDLRVAYIICSHIENVTHNLEEKSRIIIENEVMKGKTGRWYEEYFSVPSYYRHRKVAYKVFLSDLEK